MTDTRTLPAAERPPAAGWRARLQSPAWLDQGRAQATRHWRRLAPRERRLVSWALAVGGLALVWVLMVEPAWQTVNRLGTALPALRAQAAQVDAVLAEARTLQRQPALGQSAGDVTAEIQDGLLRAGLAGQATLAATGEDTWTIRIEAAPIDALTRWMQDLPATQRLQPVGVDIARPPGEDGRPLAGVVTGEVVLARAGAEAR